MSTNIEFKKDYRCWCLIPTIDIANDKFFITIDLVFLCFCINLTIDK